MRKHELYRNYIDPSHPTAFSSLGSVKRFYNGKYGTSTINKMLGTADSYTRHREFHKPRRRNPYFIYWLRQQIQIDLIDVIGLSEKNDDVTFLLAAIDCFSKKLWVKPLLHKTAAATLEAMKQLVSEISPKIEAILFDRGKEFVNRLVTDYLTKENIKIIHPNSEIKAGTVERVNRTLQNLIYRFIDENETDGRFIHVLQDLVNSYNTRGHSTLQYMTPEEAEKPENSGKVLCALNIYYSKAVSKRQEPKFSLGQTVKISIQKDKMSRGYKETTKDELFKIIDINKRLPIPMYTLQSLNDKEIIEGGFYANEIQPIYGNVYKINEVLKSEHARGRRKSLFPGEDSTKNTTPGYQPLM